MCGEKSRITVHLDSIMGSPPRVRGKEDEPQFIADFLRITPACAGKSLLLRVSKCTHEDHPRVCGEKKGVGGQAE